MISAQRGPGTRNPELVLFLVLLLFGFLRFLGWELGFEKVLGWELGVVGEFFEKHLPALFPVQKEVK